MMHLILILMTITLSVFGDEMVGIIVDNFNARNFKAIYSHFDASLKKAISEQTFESQMNTVRSNLGLMQDYLTIDTGKLYFICETNLDTGVVNYQVDEVGDLKTFFIKYEPKSTFTYLYENKENSKVSLAFNNPRHTFWLNEKIDLSICSVYKITLVVEYARQVTEKLIDPLKCVDLSKINIYFMPHVDHGHAEWLKTINKTCALHEEIVVGMIRWSSNAIAEYLTDLLTPKKVDALITQLKLNHSKTLYVVSSMFAMNNTFNLPRNQYLNYLRLMTEQEIRELSEINHQKLKNFTIDRNQDSFYLDPEVIDIHVELLERSNSASYLLFMQTINNNMYLDTKTLETIKLLFDQVSMTSNFSQGSFTHLGAKGGSASYPGMKNNALAVAGYAEMGTDVKAAYAFFMNGLSLETYAQRLLDLNLFILALETSEYYVIEFIKRMNQKKSEETTSQSNLRQLPE